jgi:uncharacterized protein (DUF58 family)
MTGLLKGINLITLLACFLVVLVGWNYVVARRQLRGVRARRTRTEPIFARAEHHWTVRLENLGRRPVSAIRVRDGAGDEVQQWFVADLAGRDARTLHARAVFPRRGRLDGHPLRLACGYPLGLADVARADDAPEALTVLPPLGRLHRGTLRRLLNRSSPSIGQSRGTPCRLPTAQTEFHGLRDYRAGDSPRHIHWRTSARRGDLMVREFEEVPNDNLTLIVEAWTPVRPAGMLMLADADDELDPVLERTLGVAATVVWEWCRQKGDRFTLLLAGAQPHLLSGVTGRDFALQMLECLALEPGSDVVDTDSVGRLLEATELPPGPILALSTRGGTLAGPLERLLRRRIAAVNVGAGDEQVFFDP